ncbi:Ig-like domain-containing protein, partial [Ferrimonas senticii]|uniref:Ig-like domain-containing protein n=1 Tax=Ferrimonas senticii TaxID=394566 RepID=UPI0004820CAB
TVVINDDGTLTFTPNANFNGDTTISYTVTDANGDSSDATVAVTVNAVNDAPLVSSNEITVNEASSGALGLSAPTDADGDNLTITVTGLPTIGSITLADGTTVVTNGMELTAEQLEGLLYQAPDDYNDGDAVGQFSYSVNDGNGGTVSGGVSITVNPTNDAPDAVDDYIQTVEESTQTLYLLNNDSDADGDDLTITHIAGVALTPGTAQRIDLDGGYIYINAKGDISFSGNRDFFGQVQFDYTISDGNGGSDTATATLEVRNQPDNPTAVTDNYTVNEDGTITLDLLANDLNPDDNGLRIDRIHDTFIREGEAYSIDVGNGTVNVAADGTITFVPAANFNGDISFRYDIMSGGGQVDGGNVNITVTPENDAPDAVDDYIQAVEEGTQTLYLLNNDSDADGDDLTITHIAGVELTPGTAQRIDLDGGYIYINASGDISFTGNRDFFGQVQFEYTISDGNGGSDSATATLEVRNEPDIPTAVDDSYTVNEDGTITLNLLANDLNPDNNGLTVERIHDTFINEGQTYSIDVGNGTVNVAADGTITFVPNANFSGDINFDYWARSGGGQSDRGEVAISVTPDDADAVINDDSASTDEDNAVSGNVLSNDVKDDSDLTVTGFTINGDSTVYNAGDTITISGVGEFTLNADGSYTFSPASDWNGEVPTISYTTNTGQSANLDITVNAVNDAPKLSITRGVTFTEDSGVEAGDIMLSYTTFDADGDAVTVKLSNTTYYALDGNGNVVLTQAGADRVNQGKQLPDLHLTPNDGTVDGNVVGFGPTVIPVNDAPEAQDDSYSTFEDRSVTLELLKNDSDEEGDDLTVTH